MSLCLNKARNGGAVGSAQMASPAELMQQEKVYLQALPTIRAVYQSGKHLVPRNFDRQTVLEFSPFKNET